MPVLGMTVPRSGMARRVVAGCAAINAHVENACFFKVALTVTQP